MGEGPNRDAFLYLQRFGYISDDKSFTDITNTEFSEALIEFQHFMNIEATGVLDDNTVVIMKKERCSEPDIRHSKGKRRLKRSLGGHKWVPFDKAVPELPLNWWVVGKDSQTYGDLIEEAGNVWQNVADVNLRRLSAENITYYHNIFFNIIPMTLHTKPKLNYTITPLKRTTHFQIAGNFNYDAFNVTIDSSATKEELTTQLKPNAVYLFVHIWGHLLGLNHSTDNPSSVMYPIYDDKTDPTLSQEDITDIQTLYGMGLSGNQADLIYVNKKRADWYAVVHNSFFFF